MTAPIDLYHLLERCAALESEALSRLDPGIQAQGFPYTVIVNDVYPYFSNQAGQITVSNDSEDIDEYRLTVTARLIVGYVEGGAWGEYEKKLYVYIPQIIHYFNEREMLQSDAYETRANIYYARIVASSGITRFSVSGTGQDAGQIGATFTIEISLYNELCQQYL
jgi:hypothetical protein